MTDLLTNAVEWLNGVANDTMADSVTVRRGATAVTVDHAIIGQTIFRLHDESGAEVRVVRRDYLIAAGGLGALGEPEIGDQFEEADNRKYEVLSPGAGEPEWRWSDPFHVRMRIHTKEITSV